MKITKLIPLVAISLGACVGSASFLSLNKTESHLKSNNLKENYNQHFNLTSIEDSTELTEEEIDVSIISSTTTEISQAYKVKFSCSVEGITDSKKNVYVVIDDSNFDPNLSYPPVEDEEQRPHFNGYVYAIKGTKNSKNIIIPKRMLRTTAYIIDIVAIREHVVCDSNEKPSKDSPVYDNIESILIPSSIETIPNNAFINCGETEFRVDGPRPASWGEHWTTSSNVIYNYEIKDDKELSALEGTKQSGSPKDFSSGESFICGYLNDKYQLPLQVGFDVKKEDGTIENRVVDLPLSRTGINVRPYDGVGTATGTNDFERNIDIDLNRGEVIDHDSLVFRNIYRYTYDDEHNIIPDTIKGAFHFSPRIAFSNTFNFQDFLSYNTYLTSKMGQFINIGLSLNKVEGVYKEIKSDTYRSYEADINKGNIQVRYLFQNLSSAFYRFEYKNADGVLVIKDVPIATPTPYHVFDKDENNRFGFLIDCSLIGSDFSFYRLESIKAYGLYIQLDLFNNSTSRLINKSRIQTRFGGIVLFDNRNQVNHFDLDLMILITSICYMIGFGCVAVGLYFFKKEKYKNDEFLRVNGKKYVKESIKNFIGFALVFYSLLFNIMRWVFFKSGVVVFNPIDPFVIGFTIFALIFIGFAIKNVVVAIKNNNERKTNEKLKLVNAVEDDGTK